MTASQLIVGVTVSYSVYRLSRSRAELVPAMRREDRQPIAVLAVVSVAILFVLLRFTVIPTFGELDHQLWRGPKDPAAWVTALIIAILIAIIAVRSDTHPLTRTGERPLLFALAVASMSIFVMWFLDGLLGMYSLGNNDSVEAIRRNFYDLAVISGTTFVATAFALISALVLPSLRGTITSRLALIGVVSILPLTAVNFARALGHPIWMPIPDAAQLTAAISALALVLAVWNIVCPRKRVSSSVILRLSLGALLVVTVAIVLDFPEYIGHLLVVSGVLLSLLWLMPLTASDKRRHGLNLLTVSAVQLLAVVLYISVAPMGGSYALTAATTSFLAIVVSILAIDTKVSVVVASPFRARKRSRGVGAQLQLPLHK